MAPMILRRLKDKSLRLLLYFFLLEIALLVFQYAIAEKYMLESRKVIGLREEMARAMSINSSRGDRLSRYQTGLAELESALPRSVESGAEAAALVTARLSGHGVTAGVEGVAHDGDEIRIIAHGESDYSNVLRIFAGLQEDARAANVRELSIQALDGEMVSFSAKIDFFQDARTGERTVGANNEER